MSTKKAPIRPFAKAAHVGATNRAPEPVAPELKHVSLKREGSADALGQVLQAAQPAVPEVHRQRHLDSGAGASAAHGLRRIDTMAELATVRVGEVVQLSTQLVQDNPDNAREFYRAQEVDITGQSIQKNRQDVPACGWIGPTGVLLKDGGKRLRGARSVSVTHLKVEIVEPPTSRLDAWLTSRRMNIERSTHTCYDDAVRFRQFLDSGEVKGQAELAARISEPGEQPKSQSYVSQILSIGAIPRSLMARLIETPPLCSKNAAYEISRLFTPDTMAKLALQHADPTAPDAGLVEAERVVEQIIVAATANPEMTSSEVKAIVQRATGETARAARARTQSEPVSLAKWQAKLTAIPQHKLLRLEFHDVPEEQMEDLRLRLKAVFDTADK